MDSNSLHSWLNSALAIISILSVLWIAAVKLTKLEVKVETMWGFLLKRAVVEGLDKGLMTLNSPVRLTPASVIMLRDLAEMLQECYRTEWKNLNDKNLAFAIERAYGDRLVHEICIPNGISLGVCLLIATAIAKGEHTLTEILDEHQIPTTGRYHTQ